MVSCYPDMTTMIPLQAEPAAAARFFRVLGDATRLRILELLLDRGEMTVGELVTEVGQPQPRVSTHLACLRHCGLALEGLDALLGQAAAAFEPIAERLASCTRI